MTGPDVPGPELPNVYPLHSEVPGLPGEALDALLAGNLLAAGAAAGPELAPGLEQVADLLGALSAAPSADELTGHDQALAAFRHARAAALPPAAAGAGPLTPTAPAGGQPAGPAGRKRRFTAILSTRAAAAAAGAVATLAVITAAAYLGALPAPMQQWAHDAVGAPAAHRPGASPASHQPVTPPSLTSRPSPTRAARHTHAGPSPAPVVASTPAAQPSPPPAAPPPAAAAPPGTAGRCRAYERANPHAREHSAAFRRLIAAAGGANNVAAYCASVTGSPSP